MLFLLPRESKVNSSFELGLDFDNKMDIAGQETPNLGLSLCCLVHVIVPDDTFGFLDMRIHSYTFYIGKDLCFSSMFSS